MTDEPQIILNGGNTAINNFGELFDAPADAFTRFSVKPKYPPQFYWLIEDAVNAYMTELYERANPGKKAPAKSNII